MLVVNTVGILEIVYLFVFAKLRFETLFSMGGKKDEVTLEKTE